MANPVILVVDDEHRTMEAWSLHMLSITLIAQRRVAEARDAARARGHALPRRG